MTNDQYHADTEFVTGTQLCTFHKSHYDYYAQYITGEMERKSTPLTEEGSLLHAVIVENRSLTDLLHTYPDESLKSNGTLRSGTEAEYAAMYPDRMYRKQQRYDELDNIVTRVAKHPLAVEDSFDSKVLREVIQKAIVFGIPCKCRPDLLRPEKREVIDYKFMERIYPENIQRSASNFKYWLKIPHYCRVIGAVLDCDPRDITFILRCVETNPPYRIFDREYDGISLDQAYGSHEKVLRDFGRCREANDWTDNWSHTIAMKPWDADQDDEDLIGMEAAIYD